MKTFVVPAFFLVYAEDQESADRLAIDAVETLNVPPRTPNCGLYLDEGLQTTEVPELESEIHTLLDVFPQLEPFHHVDD